MKRIIFLCIFWSVSALCFAQTSVTTLDRALSDAVVYFGGRLEGGAKVIILNINTASPQLSDYIIDELAMNFVNNSRLIVIERRNLELIRQEMNFQMSGDVSDETAQAIGRILGAELIVSGSLTALGDLHRLRLQALSVETAQIAGMINLNVPSNDRVIMALLPRPGGAQAPAAPAAPAPAAGGAAPPTAPLPTFIETAGGKPQRKTPARAGNFEITQGRQIRAPIDMTRFNTAAQTSLGNLRYAVISEGLGFIVFTVRGGNWWVQIRLCYWEDEYWFEYINSHNLGSNPARNRIHRNYPSWITRVERQLGMNYF